MGTSHAMFLFREYMGTGLVVIWFLLSLVFLFFKEKRKPVRILFLYTPIVMLVLFFNPLFEMVMNRFLKDEIYYRILWLLPMTVVLAYSAVKICLEYHGKKRLGFTLGFVVLIIISGKYIYDNPNFTKAQNMYHVPDAVVHICDAITIPGREVTAVFPLELLQYVRQYDPTICMPYGREILVERWNQPNDLCEELDKENPDTVVLGALAHEYACVYIVISQEKELKGDLAATGYAEYDRIDGYVIYKDVDFVP